MLRAPYHVTLWTYLHLQQREKLEGFKDRGHALYVASLMTYAFHDPKKLNDEHQRLLASAGQVPTPEAAIRRAEGIIQAVAKLDALEAGR